MNNYEILLGHVAVCFAPSTGGSWRVTLTCAWYPSHRNLRSNKLSREFNGHVTLLGYVIWGVGVISDRFCSLGWWFLEGDVGLCLISLTQKYENQQNIKRIQWLCDTAGICHLGKLSVMSLVLGKLHCPTLSVPYKEFRRSTNIKSNQQLASSWLLVLGELRWHACTIPHTELKRSTRHQF